MKLYREVFGLEDATFVRVDHRDAMLAVVYKVTVPSKKPLILKICPQDAHFHRELYFLNALSDTLPVPKVYQVMEPAEGRPGALLMECFEGVLSQ